ncbi:MAG: diadenylate cyclase [Planctomycetaceae bacterium]
MSAKQVPITPETLVNATDVVELKAVTRDEAIQELIAARQWSDYGIAPEQLIAAIEEREAQAQTIVSQDLAIPHASVAWDGDFHVILGRSRHGVQYGAAGGIVKLVVLLVTGKNQATRHLQILAALAEVLKSVDFRRQLIDASGPVAIRRLLLQRVGQAQKPRSRKVELAQLSVRLTEQAVQLAMALEIQAILLAVDRPSSVPWETLEDWPGRLLLVATDLADDPRPVRTNLHTFEVPHAGLSRIDRANLGMLLAGSMGLLSAETDVVCVTGPSGQRLDCIAVIRPADKFHAIFQGNVERGTARIPPAVVLRVLSLAIEIASEGREGKPIGTMFVIGDTRQVARRTQQLVLNPFHGYARHIRNVLDPGLAETIKEYASLDGAFIVAADGTMLSAGTYVIPETGSDTLVGGLGARHQAAASITARTNAMAIIVSQSTGKVTIFQDGGSVLSLEKASLTRW